MFKILKGLFIILTIITYFFISKFDNSDVEPIYNMPKLNKIPEISNMEKDLGVKLTSRGVKYIVDPEKIVSGGPPMDGIPSIDNPKFVNLEEANKFIADNELVLVLVYKEEVKVYPLSILVWHEIVNDIVAEDPILISYCPLCGTGIAYERKIDEKTYKFGTSGKLYNSNLVMYDRVSNSYWSQIDGKAIVGELSGTELKSISIDTVSWREFKTEFKTAKVMSTDTGFKRSYGSDPYGSYYEDSFLFFPVENNDIRIHPKTVIFGIEIDGVFKAYKEKDIPSEETIRDIFNGVNIDITKTSGGLVRFINMDTGKEIVKERGFWFSWYAFHPKTEVFSL